MKYLEFIIVLLIFSSCSTNKIRKSQNLENNYLIMDIKSKNNWNIIYAKNTNETIKIISRKEEVVDNCNELRIGKTYYFNFELENGIDEEENTTSLQTPINYLDASCFSYDSETVICTEPNNEIFELLQSKALKGLCYLGYE